MFASNMEMANIKGKIGDIDNIFTVSILEKAHTYFE